MAAPPSNSLVASAVAAATATAEAAMLAQQQPAVPAGAATATATANPAAAATKPSPPQPQLQLVPTPSYAAEIQSMLFGFGDCTRPLLETASVVETIVKEQMRAILYRAVRNMERRAELNDGPGPATTATKVVSVEEVLFLMRKSPVKVQRLLKYFSVKDTAVSMQNLIGQGGAEPAARGVKRCRDFLTSIDTNGTLLKAVDDQLLDEFRLERMRRLDRLSRHLDERKYAEFTRARQVNFLRHKMKYPQKFYDWLTRDCADWLCDTKIDKVGVQVFSYLAYETVGQLVDMALLVRHDAGRDPFRRATAPVAFNAHYPMVQLSSQLGVLGTNSASAADESPLRKRLRSGNNGNGNNSGSAGNAGDNSNASSSQSASADRVQLHLNPLRPDHIREAYRRLTQRPTPFSLYNKVDARHQPHEAGREVIIAI